MPQPGTWIRLSNNDPRWYAVKRVTAQDALTRITLASEAGKVLYCVASDVGETRSDNPWTA